MEKQGDQAKERDSVTMLHNAKPKGISNPLPSLPDYQRSQISYRNKLLEKEDKMCSQELEDQMKEWLCEEKEISPSLTEEQKILIESLPKLSMSDERLMDLCRPWKDALILTLLGKSANLAMMKDRIAWILRSKSFELIDLPNNYFVFKTGNKDLRLRLLFDGPWVIQGHYLAVQRWSPNFNPYNNEIQKVAVWVRIPTLPMHVYSEECLLEIGNMIGKALKVDVNTLAQCNNQNMLVERGKFARVSVEVDLNQALKSRFVIRSTIYTVEYEGLDLICFKCGKYGHSREKCPLIQITGKVLLENSQPEVHTNPTSKNPSYCNAHLRPLVCIPGINSDEEFGSWMIAKRYSRNKNDSKVGKITENFKSIGKAEKHVSGSRFDVLQEVEDPTYPKGVDRLKKAEVATATWKRKEGQPLPPINEGAIMSIEKVVSSEESGNKEVAASHIEKEKLNLNADGKHTLDIGEPHLKPSVKEEKKGKVMKAKEKEGKPSNVPVGQSEILSQTTHDYNLRPNGLSSVRNKKKAARAHNVIFGNTKSIEISKSRETKEQAGGKKKINEENKELVPCNPDIAGSSTKKGMNDDVDKGKEDSGDVPSSLPPTELIEQIAIDADFVEGQESYVAETQFELGRDLDVGQAR